MERIERKNKSDLPLEMRTYQMGMGTYNLRELYLGKKRFENCILGEGVKSDLQKYANMFSNYHATNI